MKLRLNRIRPLRLQASLQAHDLVQKHGLVDVGQHFGKVSVFATMPVKFYSRKLERTSSADRLNFNGRLVQINMNLIGIAIVASLQTKKTDILLVYSKDLNMQAICR